MDNLAGCLSESKDLEFEYKQWERALKSHSDHTHKFLIDALSRSITRDQAATQQPKAPPTSESQGSKVEKFFIAENGDKLKWLPTEKFLRVQKCCYDHAKGKCELSAEECLAKNGKVHDTLPKDLLPYLRDPKSKSRDRARSPSREREENVSIFCSPNKRH